jgi:t-SNARE complex subunit (syntaxin)
MGEMFKALGSFLAKNWQMLALIGVIVLFFVAKNDYAALKKSMDIMAESYQEQLTLLQELHDEEITRRETAIASYEELIKEINDRHARDLEDILRQKEEEIEKNIRDFEEHPQELIKEIEDLFGFEYVE